MWPPNSAQLNEGHALWWTWKDANCKPRGWEELLMDALMHFFGCWKSSWEAFTMAAMLACLLPVTVRSRGAALEAKSRNRNCVSENQCLLPQSQADPWSCIGLSTWIMDPWWQMLIRERGRITVRRHTGISGPKPAASLPLNWWVSGSL